MTRWLVLLMVSAFTESSPRIVALELGCVDVPLCADFYENALGFERESGDAGALRNGDLRVVLTPRDSQAPAGDSAHINLNLSVGELETAQERVRESGRARRRASGSRRPSGATSP